MLPISCKEIGETSISILVQKSRQSRVTISGDKCYFYENSVPDNK
jgi:hypothetical protein